MLTVIDQERIRRAFYVEGKSRRKIAQELGHGYWTIRDALNSAEPRRYRLKQPKPAPKLDPYKARIEELLAEEAGLPRKQRYTTRNIYEIVKEAGYTGSESNLRRHVGRRRRELKQKRPPVFIPLCFQPGQDAQVDWGEAVVVMAGERRTVQLFVMRLCYSRRTFAMAFPTQRQEAFFMAHNAAFDWFGGVAHTLTYDNLKTAVKKMLKGRNRQEQERFIHLRSHYLFDSRFCTPAQGHEKGGVEHGVKYVRQNFLTPLVEVADFAELNQLLQERCLADETRRVDRQPDTIAVMFQQEQPQLRPLPAHPFAGYSTREVMLNRYCQVVFETNHYSVPAQQARKQLTLHVYPFRIEVWHGHEWLTTHPRSYERKQDILDPLHYLPLLAQRPGAFEHAAPLQQWREQWPPAYETLLTQLKTQQSATQAVREFIAILQLHNTHPADQVAAAIEEAVALHIGHLAGVTFCLNKACDVTPVLAPVPIPAQSPLATIGTPPVPATHYNQLLPRIVT
jgi:transposase